MIRERMLQLRRVAESMPADRVCMNWWTRETKCGTAHCLAGWAALDPWMQSETPILELFRVDPDGFVTTRPMEIYRNFFDELSAVYGLTPDDGKILFGADLSSDDVVSKAQILANIDRVLGGQPAVPYV